MKIRIVVAAMAAATVCGTVTGLAATLPVTTAQLGSGNAAIASCDTDGVTASYTPVLGLVTTVSVTGIADGSSTAGAGACDGETVHVELLNSGGGVITGAVGSSVNTGDTDTTTNSVSVVMTVAPLASAVAGVSITIT